VYLAPFFTFFLKKVIFYRLYVSHNNITVTIYNNLKIRVLIITFHIIHEMLLLMRLKICSVGSFY